MNVHIPPPVQAPLPAEQRTWPGRLVTLATVIVVVAVAVATFVLSYSGVQAVALQSGVSSSLARYYPGVFDAVLVIACAAAPLRDARLWTRLYTWLVILVVIGLVGAMDAVHAMSVALPHRQTAGTVAVLPWVLLLLAFSLWLVVLRHFRVQQSRRPSQVPFNAPESPNTPELTAARQAPQLPQVTDASMADQAPEATEASTNAGRAGRSLRPALPPAPDQEAERDAKTVAGQTPTDDDHRESTDPAGTAAALSDATTRNATARNATARDAASVDLGEEPVADEPGQSSEADGITEVGGIPYATGPRLRRVRSLPVPPAEDE